MKIFYTGGKHHLYEVSFTPKVEALNALNTDQRINYLRMFESKKFISYLRVYNNTKQASKCKEIQPMEYCVPQDLLGNIPYKDIVDSTLVKAVLGPLVMIPHEFTNNLFEAPLMDVTAEISRNHFFVHIMRSTLDNDYVIGQIELPSPFKNPYSEYGRSISDFCVINKKNKHAVAVVSWSTELCDEGNMIDEDEYLYDGVGGTVEFKNQDYATQQAAKEMLRSAGDLTAKLLLDGCQVSQVIIFGMAANYQTSMGNLLKLIIDFKNSKSEVICAYDAIPIEIGINWLLKSISA